jgi:hypothetical protein
VNYHDVHRVKEPIKIAMPAEPATP